MTVKVYLCTLIPQQGLPNSLMPADTHNMNKCLPGHKGILYNSELYAHRTTILLGLVFWRRHHPKPCRRCSMTSTSYIWGCR